MTLPLFPVTTVGSWPRPTELLRAQRARRRGDLGAAELAAVADRAVIDVLRLQEEVGVDLVTDGEQRRDNFCSFVADKLDGVRLMTLAEMLDLVEDKQGFERILATLDVPAYAISNAVCVDRIERRQPLAVDELRFVKAHSARPVKVTLPGPYLLTRSMFVPSVSRAAYATKEELGDAVVALLREELRELAAAGADFVQLDEPVLTELVFAPGQPRSFMCAALAARRDPAEELELAVELVNRVLAGLDGPRTGLHVCRGNWSPDESTLLRGSYHPLQSYFGRMNVRQLVLEYATERAGALMPFEGKELGLGVVNPRTSTVESPDDVRRAVARALATYRPEAIFLNPDCGFGTFANRPVNDATVARAKLASMVAAARSLREEVAPSYSSAL
jgi:5-methyltetrahydropteroyltriglutamate--homocysteine methyltransferase